MHLPSPKTAVSPTGARTFKFKTRFRSPLTDVSHLALPSLPGASLSAVLPWRSWALSGPCLDIKTITHFYTWPAANVRCNAG